MAGQTNRASICRNSMTGQQKLDKEYILNKPDALNRMHESIRLIFSESFKW